MSRLDHLRHRTVELAQLAALGLAVAALPVAAQEHQTKPAAQPTDKAPGPLQTELNAMAEQFAKSADPAMLDTFAKAIDNLVATGILEQTKAVGDKAPDFELTDANGNTVALADMLAKGPVVLTFYRGGWCPYCNVQLRSYQEDLSSFTALGASLVAVSPELPDNALATAEKNELKFTVLSDSGNEVADAFGLRYEIDPAIAERFGPMLETNNGEDSHTLPLTATYVIDQKGVIRYALVTADYKVRAEPADIVSALKHIKMGH